MIRGTHSPMQWMLDLRTYGMKVHLNTTTLGTVGWMNHDQILYKQFQFTIEQFRGFIHSLVVATRDLLVNRLMFDQEGSEIPLIPWTKLFDDPSEGGVGWSFLKDQRTPWPVDGSRWLIDRVWEKPESRRKLVNPDGDGLRMAEVDKYLEWVADFREKLAVCVHISGGQPSRAPELLSIRHRNTDSGGHCNVFIEDGLVVFVTRYHKGFHTSNDTKVIHRYLPREVGQW
jgi:hypothetical protein